MPAEATSPDLTQLLAGQYGPIAFGLIALLVLWKFIVKPALDERRIDSVGMGKIAESMTAVATAMTSAAFSMTMAASESKEAAKINQSTTDNLKLITDRVLGLTETGEPK